MNMRHNKFTLVELLVVICIASLLMGVVLPAFNRMVTGSAVDRLASNLKLRLERARSQAASENKDIALILPSGSDSDWSTPQEKAARLGGSRMCVVKDPDDELDVDFVKWVINEDWTLPERGACLVYVSKDDPVDTNGTPDDPSDDVLKSSVVGTTKKIALKSVSALTDETSGKDKPLKSIRNYNKSGSARSNCAVIFSPGGSMRSAGDVYLVIHEAMVMPDGSLLYPGGGVQFSNFLVLKINRLTGKVEYHR